MSLDIYAENIMDHYRHPRNIGKIKNPDIHARDTNPVCGDIIDIYFTINGNGDIKDIKFSGDGCAISQASASMLTEKVKGKKLDKIGDIKIDDVLKMLNIPIGPARMKCALLPLKVLKLGYYNYKNKS